MSDVSMTKEDLQNLEKLLAFLRRYKGFLSDGIGPVEVGAIAASLAKAHAILADGFAHQ